MFGSGVRLQILTGVVATPAHHAVCKALESIEVREETESRDTFQMVLKVGRRGTAMTYSLVDSGILDPPTRISIVVSVGARTQVLINGIITQHQMPVSNAVGDTQLIVTGESLARLLDNEDQSETEDNQSHSTIVRGLLEGYRVEGIDPRVEETDDTPNETERSTTQQSTELVHILDLALRNSFIFYVEPSDVPGRSIAYWGSEQREGTRQPPITLNMGSATNAETINFGRDALAAASPQITITNRNTGITLDVPIPDSVMPTLAAQSTPALRTQIDRESGNLDLPQAILRALGVVSQGGDMADATGTLNVASYGQPLRARRLVNVRGAGSTNDGTYFVKRVTHQIKPGEYKQQFSLTREGSGATSPRVCV